MRVLVVSGIWPPDVGGPAVHAPALVRFLHRHGHVVEAVTTANEAPAAMEVPIIWVGRSLPPGVRHAAVAARVTAAARRADVVYATSLVRRAVMGARTARRPVVVKLVADEAYERARREGLFSGTLEDFQRWPGSRRVRALRASRTAALRHASHVLVPSAYLQEIALGWGLDPGRVSVVPNPAPAAPSFPPRAVLRDELGIEGDDVVFAFAGRLTAQKALPSLLEALARVRVGRLLLLGEGPELPGLEARVATLGLGTRVRFLGAGDRDAVLRLFAGADVAILPSAWENAPHTVVEALAVGTPVIATAVGGVPEVVRDGVNGLLVPPGDADALAEALSRIGEDAAVRAALAEAAPRSVAELAEDVVLERIERLLVEAAQ